jgi:hypothetical protein
MTDKFCHANRHHVKPELIVKRKGKKDICKNCSELIKQRAKASK